MNSKNLLSVYQSCNALNQLDASLLKKYGSLKSHEVRVLNEFCQIMMQAGCSIMEMDGFFVSYSICQIGKEFDLLRFGSDFILNIEMKSELKKSASENAAKIHKQMCENTYYLKFLELPIVLFTFVEKDGFYSLTNNGDQIQKVSVAEVASCLERQTINENADPEKLFIPSNYLTSPFNSTEKFMRGEYFLTSAQQKNKEEMIAEFLETPFKLFCLSANAGTGKTLLLYDIAKEQRYLGKKVLVIHCGALNKGHIILINKYSWDIHSIKDVPSNPDTWILSDVDLIIVDESQRIRSQQLDSLIRKAVELEVPVIFSYDTKQYLKTGESTDIADYLHSNFPSVPFSVKTLTNKIRTNKRMASFIYNLLQIGSSKDNLQYDCISIDYFDNKESMSLYIKYLEEKEWVPITYTPSSINPDPYDDLAKMVKTNAHSVIGQEFNKVVFIMDENFKYNENGKLMAKESYYSANGMLYQIVTRAIDELKIVVYNNPELYKHLLEIKDMSSDL